MELLINGQKVVLRDKLPAALYWDKLAKFQGFDPTTARFEDVAQMGALWVESWGFDGDPQDVAAWGQLDLITEFAPLLKACGERMAPFSKN